MPMYLYECKECLKMYELLIKLKDIDKTVECPKCKHKMKRLMTPVPFKFN